MIKVIGVRFRQAGKIYNFSPADFQVKVGDHVIVETARGIEYGSVVQGIREVADDKVIMPLSPLYVLQLKKMIKKQLKIMRKKRKHLKSAKKKLQNMVWK